MRPGDELIDVRITSGEDELILVSKNGNAIRFQESGWDVKKLMRLMLTSQAFRRESAAPENQWVTDPKNQFLARGPRMRLDAEQVRDRIVRLAVGDPAHDGTQALPPEVEGRGCV